ncbi:MAG: AMP-binding protein [Caulobacteraceae bacterium]
MQSSMQTWRLTVDRILDHAAAVRPRTEVVTAGTGARMTYAQLHVRAQRLASALAGLGVRPGDRVAVAGAGDARQLEAWYAVTGLGAVCHPVNPRLPPERLAALLNVGGARVLFADPAFLAAVEPALRQAPAIEQVVLMGPEARILDGAVSRVTAQDVLVERGGREAAWGGAAETDPAVLVHTVGVAGEPKAVLWSHRACVLQALIAGRREGLSLSAEDVVLPLIPFWRAGAWGAVFSAPMAGARLVLPAMADIGALHELIDQEGVTLLIASPTHLQGLLDLTRGRRPRALTRAVAAGAACPPALAAGWSALGVKVLSAWGMAETTALGPMFDPAAAELHAPFGLELEVVDGDGRSAPRDGAAVGHLRARGPTVAAAYFPDGASALDVSGFLDTGDLATADAEGGVRLRGPGRRHAPGRRRPGLRPGHRGGGAGASGHPGGGGGRGAGEPRTRAAADRPPPGGRDGRQGGLPAPPARAPGPPRPPPTCCSPTACRATPPAACTSPPCASASPA